MIGLTGFGLLRIHPLRARTWRLYGKVDQPVRTCQPQCFQAFFRGANSETRERTRADAVIKTKEER